MQAAALGAAIVTTALVLLPRASVAQAGKASHEAAAEESEAVTLVFDEGAPADCPSEGDFKAEVSKLTSKARFTKKKGARRVRIELENRGTEVFGRLVTGDGKNQSSRDVHGKNCKEVSSALAIAVALTIDPEALGLGDTESPPPSETEPAPTKTKPPEQPSPPPKPMVPHEPPPEPPTKVLWGLGGGATLESAWAPQMRLGGHVFLMFGVGEYFRLNLGGARFPTRENDDLSFGAWFGYGNVSMNLALLGILRPFGSLGFEAGEVTASGSGLVTQVEAQRPWQALSAQLGLRFEMERFFLQLGGSFLVPISRQRYLVSDPFGNLTPVYEAPRFGLKQETSLGVFL